MSWIPSEAVTGYVRSAFTAGVSHYDPPPPETVPDLHLLREADRFRFANRLECWAEFAEDGRPVAYGVGGGGVMGSTTMRIGPLGVTFSAVSMPDLCPEPQLGPDWVRWTRTAGGRTAFPLPRRIARPPYMRLQSPLVWTTLALTLHADGTSTTELAGASPFPRHWVYGPDGLPLLKAGLTRWKEWTEQTSPEHTPWGDEDSPAVVTAAETGLERRLSTLIMRGDCRPAVFRLAEGEVLCREGEAGDSLYLLLDGVLAVEVDGRPLPEVGPGAVLGEHAILADGKRTATLTAVTDIRIAEAPERTVDREALAQLACGHRREERAGGAT
ncbi:cyclic nucleotide-binding domain-containing protein [Streptomyces fractus]|uniref:cyclic nucleotide-binding domain-containing protein n=1 Tax=Streptomyces fractus TaxID=641806 RepID=UPI003CF83E47